MSKFFERAREIANDYIQNIVFLDDRAYISGNDGRGQHDFNSAHLTKVFAKENKICAVYQPENLDDIENFKHVAKKSDVVVLDWQIVLVDNPPEVNIDEDEQEDDQRGKFTIDIIKTLSKHVSNQNSIKLIVIYTGEDDIASIVNRIFTELKNDGLSLRKNLACIFNESLRITVRAKCFDDEEKKNKFNHNRKFKKILTTNEELPAVILNEYALLTSGILPSMTLYSLTILRRNSAKLLNIFNGNLDAAYLAHKAVLNYQNDAENLLINIFTESINDLLSYEDIQSKIQDLIPLWLDAKIKSSEIKFYKKDGKDLILKEGMKFNKDIISEILMSKESDAKKRFVDLFVSKDISRSKADEYFKYINNNNLILFKGKKYKDFETAEKDLNNTNSNFSILTHHKSIFLPKAVDPRLTLGTIVRSSKNKMKFYLCIQQKCDSTRIRVGEERKFLFLPLDVSQDKFDIITPAKIRLKKAKESYSLKTIKFVCDSETGMITATYDEKKKTYTFVQKYNTRRDEKFVWVLDLKDMHAQRIINNYASKISRVGLDESEWHRNLLSEASN